MTFKMAAVEKLATRQKGPIAAHARARLKWRVEMAIIKWLIPGAGEGIRTLDLRDGNATL